MQRSMLVMLIGTVVLLLAGVLVALVTAHRTPTTFPAGSPQATVATYLRLLQDGQVDDAYAMAAFDQPTMTRERYHQAFDHWNQQPHRVTLLRTTVTTDQATVTVEISTFTSTLLGAGDHSSQQTFTLLLRQGHWLVTGPPYLFG
jgi:hypothetical protein